jgi:hypothetical protein
MLQAMGEFELIAEFFQRPARHAAGGAIGQHDFRSGTVGDAEGRDERGARPGIHGQAALRRHALAQ